LPLVGLEPRKAVSPHKALMAAIEQRLGPRVVAASGGEVAARREADPAESTLVATMAAAALAERAIVVEVTPLATLVRVYGSFDGTPPLLIEIPKKKGIALDKKWAALVADAVGDRATDLLAARIEAPVVDLSEPEPTAPEPPPPPPPTLQAPPAETVSPLPRVAAAIGGGVALRFLELSGSHKPAVAPMELGPLPSVSAFVAVRPLAFIDPRAWWSDLLVEAWGRRALVGARVGESVCSVDDDEVTAALSWRARLSDNPLVPSVGAGASAGTERFVVGACEVPAVSVSSVQAAAFGRLAWRPLPRLLEVDLLGGARLPFVPEGTLVDRPGLLGQLAVQATPLPMLPWMMVRAVARAHETRLRTASAAELAVGDVRASFELQVGGAL
jgi:hypothetical protein